MELTKQQLFELNKKYLHSDGTTCPICEKVNGRLEVQESENFDGHTIKMTVSCDNCKATWSDIYKLVKIEDVVVGSVAP